MKFPSSAIIDPRKEVFNAVGETIAAVTVREWQIEELRRDEVLSVRPREFSAA